MRLLRSNQPIVYLNHGVQQLIPQYFRELGGIYRRRFPRFCIDGSLIRCLNLLRRVFCDIGRHRLARINQEGMFNKLYA